MEPYGLHPIRRYRDGRFTAAEDCVIREARVELIVNDEELRVGLLCLPRELAELAAGFLRTEGALRKREDLHAVEYDEGALVVRARGRFDPDALEAIHRRWTLGTGCGGGGTSASLDRPAFRPVAEGPVVEAEALLALMRLFQQSVDLWKRTGGVHACALADAAHVHALAEDVGRHNAFDKVIGMALLRGIEVADKLLLTTGRISTDMASKAVAAQVPLVVGRGAVTGLAIELARRFGLTLVGFARGGRLNVYTGYQRIVGGPGAGPTPT